MAATARAQKDVEVDASRVSTHKQWNLRENLQETMVFCLE
jgi:hypothetical protein